VTKVFNQLCIRNERRQFLQVDGWQWPPLVPSDLALRDIGGNGGEDIPDEDSAVDGAFVMKNSRIRAVLTYIPQVIKHICFVDFLTRLSFLFILGHSIQAATEHLSKLTTA
jgi:hypothetical protein